MRFLRWTCGLAVVASLCGMTAAPAREKVVVTAPHSAVVFAAMGLPVNLDRLEIGPVQATLRTEDGRRVLVVEGDIGNPRDGAQPLPKLHVSVRDGSGTALYSWTTSPGTTIAGRGRVPFRARLTAPPAGQDVVVEFVRPAA